MSITAAPHLQLRLLDVQALDTRLAQNAHRRRTLPQRTDLASLRSQADSLRDLLVAAQAQVSDLTREQAKADADVETVRVRAERDRQRLEAGSATPKELEGLQRELESLARRQAELEDVELEIMERLETATASLTDLTAQRAVLDERIAVLEAEIAAAEAVLDDEDTALSAERALIADEIPADLQTLYERLRADQGGIGAAALHRGQCTGCRISLNASEIVRLREAAGDAVLRCEECRRILVRTPESGL